MKVLNDISSIDRQQWVDLINRSPVASVFQSPELVDFFTGTDLYETKLVAVEEDDTLKGLVACLIQAEGKGLKRRLTSRAIINGGPLLDEDISDEALKMLLMSVVTELKDRCIYIETRNLNDYSRWKALFEKCGYEYQPHYDFHIDTSAKEAVERNFDKSRRRRIRKAVESGAVISSDTVHLPAFYKILSDLYRSKVHKPIPPYKWFEGFSETPMASYFFVLNPEGETIGGQLILKLGNSVAYALYCCGLDKEYRDLHPSIMANYAAIRYAADQGFRRFDMMGAGAPGDKYGVREFKAQFGGILVEYGRFLHVCNPLIYKMGKMVIKMFSKMHKS